MVTMDNPVRRSLPQPEGGRCGSAALPMEARLEAALANTSDAVFIADAQGRFVAFNQAFATHYRFPDTATCFKTFDAYRDLLEVFLPSGEAAPSTQWAVPRALRGETATNAEFTVRRKDTGESWVGSYSYAPIRTEAGEIVGAVVTGRDLTGLRDHEEAIRVEAVAATERRHAEARRDRFNRAQVTLLACTQTIIHAEHEAELLWAFCRICRQIDGIERVWVGQAAHDETRSLLPAATLGFPDGAWDHARLTWADDGPGQNPAALALRTGRPCLWDHAPVAGEPGPEPWAGTGATLALPLTAGAETYGALVLHAGKAGHFDEQYLELLEEVADNLSIGLTGLRARAERDQALGNAEHLAEQLRSLALELGQTEQRERLRLAHVLHDHLQQLLVGATFSIEALGGHVPTDEGRKALDRVTDTIQKAIRLSRVLTVELSPPAVLGQGLAASLAWLGRNVQENHGLRVSLALEGDPEPVPEPVRLFLFEAVREILLNVVKHAKVDQAWVRLRVPGPDRIEVTIEDRGVGFDVSALQAERFTGEGLGLFSLRERLRYLKGSMAIQSRPGHGSRFTLVVPTQGWPVKRKA